MVEIPDPAGAKISDERSVKILENDSLLADDLPGVPFRSAEFVP